MNHPKVIVITLNWNRKEDTIECVKSLLALDYPDYKVIVVDNGSTDGSVQAFKKNFPAVTVIENERNLGYGQGFNAGIRYALNQGVKYLLIINNDTVIDRHALSELVKIAESDPDIGLVTGKVYHYKEPDRFQTVGKVANFLTGAVRNVGHDEIDHGQYDEIKEYQFLDDVFWLVNGRVFQEVGMYDKNFFIYCEEVDLCARAGKAGYKLIYTPYAKVWHKRFASSGGSINPFAVYHMTRSRIIFMRRNTTLTQFAKFMLYFLFIKTPKEIAGHTVLRRFKCIIPHLAGVVASIGWILKGLVRRNNESTFN